MTKDDAAMVAGDQPAFGHGSPEHGGHPGMTLLDYFAGQALNCVAESRTDGQPSRAWDMNEVAADAYELAQAMIEQREKILQERADDE